jgi:serine/threonine protein kinase
VQVRLGTLDGNRVVVVKQPSRNASSSSDALVRAFQHEATVAAALGQHPNLVRVMGTCPEEKQLVLEYLPLGSLRSALDNAAGLTKQRQGSSSASGPNSDPSEHNLWEKATASIRSTVDRYSSVGVTLRTSDGQAQLSEQLNLLPSSSASSLSSNPNSARANGALMLDDWSRLRIARDAAAGLAAIHAAGYAHRDVAARNVLLGAHAAASDVAGAAFQDVQLYAKVCDMGLAMRLGLAGDANVDVDAGATAAVVEGEGYGAPAWMAPEALRMPSIVSQAGDAYGFGCVLYELWDAQGREPWHALATGAHRRKAIVEQLFNTDALAANNNELPGLFGQVDARTRELTPPAILDLMKRCLSYSAGASLSSRDASDELELDARDEAAYLRLQREEAVYGLRPRMAKACVELDAALMAATSVA